jgi:hypothetical protein
VLGLLLEFLLVDVMVDVLVQRLDVQLELLLVQLLGGLSVYLLEFWMVDEKDVPLELLSVLELVFLLGEQ